ncbi:MAG: hypothetical protein V7631_571 [Massilia sp.]|jgi:phosphinothricin acetyltransferase
MSSSRTIRPAIAEDAEAICTIYNRYVTGTTISFEEEPVLPAEMGQRIADVQSAGLPWLVMLENDKPIGYAYATKWRVRPAYRTSVETSVYLDLNHRGSGAGTLLYVALLDELRRCGLHLAIAGIAQPNEASVRLHEKLGFIKVAHFSEVGRKFGQWIDVGYWQLKLGEHVRASESDQP